MNTDTHGKKIIFRLRRGKAKQKSGVRSFELTNKLMEREVKRYKVGKGQEGQKMGSW